MKPRTLVALAVILVVLVVLVVIKQVKETPPPLEESVKLSELMPSGLGKADVARLELYSGGKADEKVLLSRLPDDPESWQIDNHFNAPVDAKKIGDFLDMLLLLKGEVRHENVSADALKQYNLADDQAFHVVGYKKDDANPAFHILVGKQADYKQVFARTADGNTVFVIDKSPRRDAGMWQEETDKAPEASVWVDKTIAKVEQDKITKIELQTPNRRLVLEKREKPKPAEEQKAEGESKEGEQAKKEETKPEYEWVLAEGGPAGKTFKQTSLDTFLRVFDNFMAVDVVDPAKKAEWGLEPPAFVCKVTRSDVTEPLVLEGGRPDPAKDGYVRVSGKSREIIYSVSQYNFDRLYALGKSSGLFDLDGLTLTKDDIERIEIVRPEGETVLTKVDNKWSVEKPKLDLETQNYTLDTVASTLASWKPADYADSATGTGLDAPTRRVVLRLKSGETHTLEFGNDSPALDGVYARLDGAALTTVIARTDFNKIFVGPKDIYQRKIADVSEDEITSVEVQRPENAFTLTRKKADSGGEDTFELTLAGATTPADKNAVESFLTSITGFEAADILPNEKQLSSPSQELLRITLDNGKQITLQFGVAQEEKRPVFFVEKGIVFVAENNEVATLMIDPNTLKPAATEPPAEKQETPTESQQNVTEAPPASTPETPAEPTASGDAETAKDSATVQVTQQPEPVSTANENPAPDNTEKASESPN